MQGLSGRKPFDFATGLSLSKEVAATKKINAENRIIHGIIYNYILSFIKMMRVRLEFLNRPNDVIAESRINFFNDFSADRSIKRE